MVAQSITSALYQLIDDFAKKNQRLGNKISFWDQSWLKQNKKKQHEKHHANGRFYYFFSYIFCVWFTFSSVCLSFLLSIFVKQCEWSNELSRGQWKALLQSFSRYVYRAWVRIWCMDKKKNYNNNNGNINFTTLLPICFFSLTLWPLQR